MITYERRSVFVVACMGMLVFGIVLTTLGAMLPDVITRFGVDKAVAGSLFLSLSFGILAGSLVFGPAVDRLGYRLPLLISLVLVAAGLQLIAHGATFALLRTGVLLIGFGGGVVNGGTNALVADISENKAAGLSLLGVFFGVGAVGVPFALGTLAGTPQATVLSAIGAGLIVPVIVTARVRFPPPKQAHGFPIRAAAGLLRERLLVALGLMLFLQSGMEITMGGWSATFAGEALGLSARTALYFLSMYWFGMMIVRLGLGPLLARFTPQRVLLAAFAVAMVGASTLLRTEHTLLAAAAIFLVGAGFAPVFPIVLGWIGERYTALSGTAFSIALVMALTGGMLLPYLAGLLGSAAGMRASLVIVPVAIVLGAALLGALELRRALVVQTQPQTGPG